MLFELQRYEIVNGVTEVEGVTETAKEEGADKGAEGNPGIHFDPFIFPLELFSIFYFAFLYGYV